MNKHELITAIDDMKVSLPDEMEVLHAFHFLRGFAACRLKVRELLENILPEDADPSPVPKPKPALKPKISKNDGMPKIDHPKIVTLWKAGWSVKKIAGEFSCAEQTIRNHLQKAKEDGELNESKD